MEAIATLSLVCNVMQVISFTGEVFGLCRRIYEGHGADPDLESNTKRFHELLSTLSSRIEDFDPIQAPQNEDQQRQQKDRERLRKVASDLLQDTQELERILGEVKNATTGGWKTFKAAVKYRVHTKRVVSDLEKRIQNAHRILNSEFLTRICSSNQAIAARSDKAFSGLSEELKAFIKLWSDGSRELSRLISAEAEGIREHITAESEILRDQMKTDSEVNATHIDVQHRATRSHIASESSRIIERFDTDRQANISRRDKEDLEARILSTLWFPEMNARENNIKEASEDTLRWIFREETLDSDQDWSSFITSSEDDTQSQETDQDSDSETKSQVSYPRPEENHQSQESDELSLHSDGQSRSSDSSIASERPTQFAQWLETEGSVFWILGKPGSSKSTVMKYLVQNEKTRGYLGRWRPHVTICRFFFIEICTNPLQRQLRGCLRTLLHQIISVRPNLLEQLLHNRPELSRKHSEHDWPLGELQEVLVEALRTDDSAFCLFLDGLDEIEARSNEQASMIELLKQLSDLPNVKICVSSRRENTFTHAVHSCSYPFLQTEMLTRSAIEIYVTSQLKPYRGLLQNDHDTYTMVVNGLVGKASGVFLWVAVAIQSITRGIMNGDSWNTLHKRIEELAPDLNGLFRQMLNRQGFDRQHYKDDTARLLWHALHSESEPYLRSVLGFILGTHGVLRKNVMDMVLLPEVPIIEEIRICQEYEKWLFSRSMGLLEINASPDLKSGNLPRFHNKVSFVHRSVREFLLDTNDGHEILLFNQTSSKDRLLRSMETLKFTLYASAVLPSSYQPFHPLDKFAISTAILASAGYIGTEEELELLLSFKRLVQSQFATKYPDIKFLKAAASWGSVVFLSQHTGRTFDLFSSQEKGEILYSAAHMSLPYMGSNLVIFEEAIKGSIRLDGDYLARGCVGRKMCTIMWLLNAGVSPNTPTIAHDLGCCSIEITPFARFLPSILFGWLQLALGNKGEEPDPDVRGCVREFERHKCDWNQSIFIHNNINGSFSPFNEILLTDVDINSAIFKISGRFFERLWYSLQLSTTPNGEEFQEVREIDVAKYIQCVALRPGTKSKGKEKDWRVPNPKEGEKGEKLEAALGRCIWDVIENTKRGRGIFPLVTFGKQLAESFDTLYWYE